MRNQVFKKLFSALLALIMVAGLLPASVLAEGWGEIAPNAETTPAATAEPTAEPTTEPAETTEPTDEPVETAEPTAEPAEGEEPAEPVQEETNLLLTNMEAVSSTIDKENYYRIVHLDCGRKYFSVDYIKGVIDAMYLNGFNQLELAFGNGGLRFVLNEMDLTDDNGNKLSYSDEVKSAIKQGNEKFYNDPNGDALTESDMKEIIKYAQGKGIEIVPLLNMPGHMDGILKSDLFSQYKLSGSKGSLDLNNTSAVAFGKALLKLYVDWFNKNSNTKYFNFGADEYGQGIQNPYIDTDKASVTYGTLISYMNDCAKIIEDAGMTARCFNDFVCYNKRNDCNLYKTVQVCYWSNQWNNSEYNTVTAIKNAGYKLINTNQKWYFVPSKAKEYGKDTVLSNFQTFDVTKFQNIINGYNIDSTTYIQINDESNVGAMFCVWCDEPSTGVELTDVKDLITAMADANPTFFTKKTIKNTTVGDTNENTTTDDADTVRVNGPELAKLACNKVEDTAYIYIAINAVNGRIAAYNIIPSTADAEYKGTAEVRIKIPDGWDKTKVKAFIVENDGTAKSIDGTATEDGWYVFTAPHFSVMGIYEQAVTYEEETVTVAVGDSKTVTVDGTQGEEVENKELLAEDGTTVVAKYKVEHVSKTGGTTRTVTDEVTLSGLKNDETADVLIGDWQAQDATINKKRPLNYMVVANGAISSTTNVNDATVFTVTKVNNYYTIKVKDDNKYIIRNNSGLSIGTSASQNNSWSVGTGNDLYYSNRGGYYLTYSNANNQWRVSNSISNWQTVAHPYSFKTETTQAEEKTEITFTGVNEGTTSVVIGGTRYTVEVKAKELGDAKLYVDFWVTSNRVKPNNLDVVSAASIFNKVSTKDKRYYHEFTAADSTFASEEGVLLTGLIPSGGEYTNTTDTTGTTNTIDAMLWKVRYLPQAYRQTAAGWTNKSGFGTDTVTGKNGGVDIERIRYYENKWQYKAVGGTDWVEFTTSMDESGDQIAAYYLLKTEVTKQVTTYITDWPDPQKTEFYGVALDYCVKYESDSTRNPNTFGKATNENTQWFNCVGQDSGDPIDNGYTLASTDTSIGDWKGKGSNGWYRVINNIRAVETDKYEIYMVTATPSNKFSSEGNQACPDSITYPEEGEKVIWAENEDVVSTSGLTAHGEIKYGGTPDINRVVIQQCTGMLITYYVRAKANASLTVHYIDDTAGGTEFYKYGIDVDSNTLFSENIDFNDGVLNNYTVKNNDKDTQKIESDLQRMPKIDAQYRYSKYKCVSVRRSDDGKDFYLHYTFDNKVTFVVDFGLPLKVTPDKVNKELPGNAKSVNVTQKNVKYGTVTVEGADFTYTLNKMINGYEMIVAEYSGVNTETNTEGKVAYNVYIIPATTVYYEDSFATFYGADKAEQKEFDASSDDDTAGVWYIDGKTATVDQALEALGDKKNVYGYDDAYKDSTMFSMGSARKVTVTNDMAKDGVVWPTAQFTFKGTGFDIISLTDNTSGAIFVDVVNAKTGAKAKSVFVDNYYGYTYDETNGWQPSTSTEPNALYQIPVIAVRGLEYAEYNVVIKVAYSEFFDHTTPKGSYSFWLDAVRVYNPAGNELDTEYGKDSEAKPVYTEVRKALIGQGNFSSNDATNVTGAVFIDGKATGATIGDYTNYGPNHEVYLAQGQAIAFKIVADSQPKTVQLGVKLANGESGTLNIGGDGIMFAAYNNKVAANSLTLGTATDMYYALTGLTWSNSTGSEKGEMVSNLIVLTNNSANIISITNVKCTFGEPANTENNTVALAISYDDALMAVSMVNDLLAPEPEPEPEKTFEPERFEASWTKNVMQGRKATLTVKTSEDVEAITVDGQTIRSYRTRTERVGFGRYAKRVTYREFTYSMVAQESADFSVTAINAEGTESEAITARLTVQKRPESIRDIWNWFKGWF